MNILLKLALPVALVASCVPALACADGDAVSSDVVRASAPADRTFGPLHMSPIGVVNALALVQMRERAGGLPVEDTIASLGLVERSIKEWEAAFPGDPWLSRVVFSLGRAYGAFDDDVARAKAKASMDWLLTRYAKSPEAASLRTGLPSYAVSPDAAAPADDTDAVPAVLRP